MNPSQQKRVLTACKDAITTLIDRIVNFPTDYQYKGIRHFRRVPTAPYLYTGLRTYDKIVDYNKCFEDIALIRKFSTNIWVLEQDVDRLNLRFKRNSRLFPSIVRFRTKTKSYYDVGGVAVYNACQFANFPHKRLKVYNQYQDVNEQADRWINKQRVRIIHGVFGPLYESCSNSIYLVDRDRYDTNAGYYHDVFHELGHWSGRRSNLCRVNGRNLAAFDDNSETYAQEELVAELTAIKLSTFFGIAVDFNLTSMYIDYYLSYFEDSSYAKAIFELADRDSDEAVLFLLESYFNGETATA